MGKQPMSMAKRSPAISEGQRLLRKAARHSSLSSIARAVGCRSRENCRCWLQGTKTPNTASRSKLEEAFGIPVRAWDLLPTGRPARSADNPCVQVAAVKLDSESSGSVENSCVAVAAVKLDSVPSGSALDDCLALLADLRSYRRQPGLLLKHRLRYMDCETRILALRARLERDVELSEDRYVREHPAWRRLQDKILHVIRPYPEIMNKLLEALTTVTND